MKSDRFLEHAILQHPQTQARLQDHRQEGAPCIFCGGAFYAPIVYFDTGAMIYGRIPIAVYNTCAACLAREDFADTVDKEYRRDLPRLRAASLPGAQAVNWEQEAP